MHEKAAAEVQQVQMRDDSENAVEKSENVENSKDMSKVHSDIETSPGCEHLLRARLEAITRELELAKRNHAAAIADRDDQFDQSKRQSEKKLAELEDEKEEAERSSQQSKKKSQRLLSELNDLKIQFDEVVGRNHDLEKKQRKFDSEKFAIEAENTELKTIANRVGREKEDLENCLNQMEKGTIDKEKELMGVQGQLEQITNDVLDTVERDVEDDAAVIVTLKKLKRELDSKVEELEEECDEQANELDQHKTQIERLQVETERSKQNHQRELDAREQELEELQKYD